MQTVQSRTLQFEDITSLSADADWTGSIIKLFTAPPVNSGTIVLADFVEATYAGYAGLPHVGWVLGLDPAGNGMMKEFPNVAFIAGALVGPQTVLGWYMVDAGLTELLAYGYFDAPVIFQNAGDKLLLAPIVYALFLGNDDEEFIAAP